MLTTVFFCISNDFYTCWWNNVSIYSVGGTVISASESIITRNVACNNLHRSYLPLTLFSGRSTTTTYMLTTRSTLAPPPSNPLTGNTPGASPSCLKGGVSRALDPCASMRKKEGARG